MRTPQGLATTDRACVKPLRSARDLPAARVRHCGPGHELQLVHHHGARAGKRPGVPWPSTVSRLAVSLCPPAKWSIWCGRPFSVRRTCCKAGTQGMAEDLCSRVVEQHGTCVQVQACTVGLDFAACCLCGRPLGRHIMKCRSPEICITNSTETLPALAAPLTAACHWTTLSQKWQLEMLGGVAGQLPAGRCDPAPRQQDRLPAQHRRHGVRWCEHLHC